jgi:hypothetical protein
VVQELHQYDANDGALVVKLAGRVGSVSMS